MSAIVVSYATFLEVRARRTHVMAELARAIEDRFYSCATRPEPPIVIDGQVLKPRSNPTASSVQPVLTVEL